MLRDALVGQEGGSCVIDILTYADLQALKSGRQPASTCARAGVPPSGNNKRYVILTQTGNERCVLSPPQCQMFCMHIYVSLTWACACTIRRVHYPLPMAPREAAPAAVVQPRGAVYVAQPAVITQPAAITPSHPDDARSISARPLLRQYDDLLREKASGAEPTSVCLRPTQALSPARSQVL
jgi:hypothetical protein